MTDQERGFLDAIIAEPDDDTHRLVFADWLDDHGQPERAEFIRVQLQQAKLGDHHPDAFALLWRELELLEEYRHDWLDEVHPDLHPDEAYFERGFLGKWEGSIADYVRYGETVHQRTPLTTFAPINDRWRSRLGLDELVACPWLVHLRNLSLESWALTDGDLVHLFSTPNFSNLVSLDLGGTRATGRTITALIGCTTLPQLRSVRLDYTSIGASSIERLAKAPILAQLEELDFSHCSIGGKGVRSIGKSPHSKALRKLRLENVGCSGEDARVLLEGSGLANLEDLDLSENALGRVGVEAIAQATHRLPLTQINLTDCGLDERALDILLTADLSKTTSLGLGGNDLGDRPLARFLDKVDLPTVNLLGLFRTGASTATLDTIVDKFPDGVAGLSLTGNPLDEDAVIRLIESPTIENTTELWLGKDLTDRVGQAIIDSPYLANLMTLRLFENRLSLETMDQLRERFGIRVRFD